MDETVSQVFTMPETRMLYNRHSILMYAICIVHFAVNGEVQNLVSQIATFPPNNEPFLEDH